MGGSGPTGLPHAEIRKEVEVNCRGGHRRSAAKKRDELMDLLLAAEGGALTGFDERIEAIRQSKK